MIFSLTIKLGNSGMRTNEELIAALRRVVHRLENKRYVDLVETHPDTELVRSISDHNGNSVGEWHLLKETE